MIIEKSNTDIIVSENGKYDVVKTITAYLNTENNHEIKITIPKYNLSETDSDSVDNVTVSSNLSGTKYKTSSDAESFIITVNDSVEGKTYGEYTVSYSYINAGDSIKDADVFKQELLGFKDVPVMNMTFSVTMPKEYSMRSLSFYDGTSDVNVFASNDETKITGYYDKKLPNGQLGMSLFVENDYFHIDKSVSIFKLISDIASVIAFVLMVMSIVFTIKTYWKFGISEKLNINVENKLINGISPVDIIAAQHGGMTNEDLFLYILQLANEGYISIECKYDSNPRRYAFTKIKEYDGRDYNAKRFMRTLFAKSDTVDSDDLAWIYSKIQSLRLKIQYSIVRKLWNVDEKACTSCQHIGLLLSFITPILLSINSFTTTAPNYYFGFIYGPVISIIIYKIMMKIDTYVKDKNTVHGHVDNAMIQIYTFGFIFLMTFILGTINKNMFVKHSWIVTVCYFIEFILMYCACNMKKRTKQGTALCEKTLGFKQFLSEADEVDMKRIVLKDEQYAYKTLPFALALNAASSAWLARMDNLHIDNPIWYKAISDSISNPEFRLTEFVNDWQNIMEDFERSKNDE